MAILATSALAVGCGSEEVPVYGGPAPDTGIVDTGADTGADTGTSDAKDSGPEAAADAGPTDTGGIGNLYGAPADVGAD